MTRLDTLDTPVVVIDLDVVERNLSGMQSYCDANGLRLRPHIKTHKLPQLARRQIELGAIGITCQKLGEAEVMADAGLDDILVSYPIIGEAKATRLASLARRVTMRVAVDNPLALAAIASAARQAERQIGVLVEFDSGMQRTGVVTPDEALALARQVQAEPRLRLDGLLTYPSNAGSAAFVAEARSRFATCGLPIDIVSGGGTPVMWQAHEIGGLTEYRVGTYAYHDRNTVAAGVATFADCALEVLATVISRPTPERAVIDAGSKTLSSDPIPPAAGLGFGFLPAYPEAVLDRLSEEHGMLDLRRCASRPALGERVRIVPNHCCVVSNLHDEVSVVHDGDLVAVWPVAARGRTR